MNLRLIYTLFLLVISPVLSAQKISFGALTGINASLVKIESGDYILIEGIDFNSYQTVQLESKIGPGLSIGGLANISFANFSIRNFIELQLNSYTYEPGFSFTDGGRYHYPTTDYNSKVINSACVFSSNITHDLKGGIYYGTGLTLGYLIHSQIRRTTQKPGSFRRSTSEPASGEYFPNNQYRNFTLAIPIIIGYEWKRNSFFLRYSHGLSNKNLKDFYVKEKERMLMLGYSLLLKKEE